MSKKKITEETKKKAEAAKKTVKKTAEKAEEKSSAAIKIDRSKAQGVLKPLMFIVVLVLLLMGVDFLVQYLNNEASIAVVDGKRISRTEYINTLEDMYGEQVANSLVEEEVISQLAEEKGVSIGDEDVDQRYAELEDEFGGAEELEQTLFMYGMTVEELKEQLENEILMEKIIRPTLEYTDDDLERFFEENKEFIFPETEDISFEDKRDEVEEMYVRQKVNEERSVVVNEYKEGISIQINTPSAREEEDRGYGVFKATRNVLSNLFGNDNTEADEE